VTNKLNAANNLIFSYQYDDDNCLTNRWTPAKTNTIYSYDNVGNLTGVTYKHSPAISFSYDADNRLTNMVDGIGTTAYSYDQVEQVLSEGGLWPNDSVSYTYQNRLRMELSLAHSSGSSWTQDYEYDDARRLDGIQSPAGIFDYTYDPLKLQRVDELHLPNEAYITNTFDSVARLLSTALIGSGGTNLDSQNYAYNTVGQRVSETNTAGDYRTYGYDNEGELVTASGKETGSANRLQEQFGYTYDAAGNLNLHALERRGPAIASPQGSQVCSLAFYMFLHCGL
jgi:YD repeat-containing protein